MNNFENFIEEQIKNSKEILDKIVIGSFVNRYPYAGVVSKSKDNILCPSIITNISDCVSLGDGKICSICKGKITFDNGYPECPLSGSGKCIIYSIEKREFIEADEMEL